MRRKPGPTVCLVALLVLLGSFLQPSGSIPLPQVLAASLDTSFTAPYNISNSPSYDASQRARLTIDPTALLHVVWMEGVLDTATGAAYVSGRDTTWGPWEWIGPPYNIGYVNPVIARDASGTIHVAYASDGPPYDVWYTSKPAGGSWAPRVNLSNEAYNTVYPSIAVDSTGRVWVAWQTTITDQNNDVFVRSKPAGGDWEPVMNVSNRTPEDQNPSIAVDAGDVPHLVWRSREPGNWEIIHTRYVGGAWTAFQNISATALGSHFPRLASNAQGDVCVAWEEDLGSDVFYVAFRRWDGSQWLPGVAASDPVKALYPAVSCDDVGNVYTVWTDYRHGPTEAYFSYSTDHGATWSADENVSNNGLASFYPDTVAYACGEAHVVWQDMAPGQFDIFYSEGTIPDPAGLLEDVVATGPTFLRTRETGFYTATHVPMTVTLPLTITWDNGAVGPTAAYSWTLPGAYTLTATATNPCGAVSTTLAVTVCQPVEEVEIAGPTLLGIAEPGLYTATYTPITATDPVTITWDNDAVGPTTAYSWTLPGAYTLTVTATNPCGEAQENWRVTVCEALHDVDFSWIPSTPTIGQIITFMASASGSAPITYTWSLGDGHAANGPVVSHTYALSSTYEVVMTAANACSTVPIHHPIRVVLPPWAIYLPVVLKNSGSP